VTERLRFALLFDGESLEPWHLRCLDELEEVAELAGVVVASGLERPGFAEGASRPLRRYLRRVALPRTDVAARFAGVPRLVADGAATLDFALKLGPGPVGAVPGLAPRHGIWWFEHERDGGLPPFFREVYDGEHVTRTALLARDARSETGTTLEEGAFPTVRHSYAASRARILDGVAPWPARACRRLLASAPGTAEARAASGTRSSRRARLLPFAVRTLGRRLGLARQRLFRHPQWNVGVLDVPAGSLLAPHAYAKARVEWLPLEGRESFVADPFGLVRDDTLHVLCEHFGYREGKGRIDALEHAGGAVTGRRERVLDLPGHASYPFLLEDAGETYCVPETSDAGEVALFRAVELPHRWEKVAVLLDGVAGLDATLFRHDGRWWLTCTRRGLREDVELWAWHAPELRGPWTEHARNPVKSDVRGARPGGTPFVHEGTLYRPAQDCSRTYGGRVVVQRVIRLTPTEYAEEPAAVLENAPGGPYPVGPHTLTAVGDRVLVDGRRDVFVWPAFRAFLGIWRRDLGRRLRPARS
jgi:hypothetical protein